MIKKSSLFLFFCFIAFKMQGQEIERGFLIPKKIGFLYNNANEKNFLFDDKDYYYTTNTFKIQAFYNFGTWKSFNFELIVQPQLQILKHQLLNEQFVTPDEDNYIAKREEFTALKTMHLYAIELGFVVKKKIVKKLHAQLTIGLGFGTIDTRTERLAKGFTFIENGSLGFTYQTTKNTILYLGSNIGHVSNFDTQSPNNGYNIVGLEVGFSYLLD